MYTTNPGRSGCTGANKQMASNKTQNNKIIFGLKVRQLRMAHNLSFAELSEQTGMSLSYLNEIEKGKKYPKDDKIEILARSLHSTVAELTSAELKQNLAPVGALLQSNFLSELPLDLFGIEISKVVEIIANAPLRVGAFISTLVELARNYALREENFYFGALRAYLELHDNYFEEIEHSVDCFVKEHKIEKQAIVPVQVLSGILEKEYHYRIILDGLKDYPELHQIRSVFVPKHRRLLLNGKLSDMQKAFQFGKELGFQYLGLKDRALTSSLLRVNSFEEVLSHFKAGYFSAALLLNHDLFVKDIDHFFRQRTWNGELLLQLLQRYQAAPELLFQRLTNVIPHYFGLRNLFFLRFIHDPEKDHFQTDKELHLSRRHHPHTSGLDEHYCRRWIAASLLKELYRQQQEGLQPEAIVGVQRSRYYGTNDEYLCITIARPSYPMPGRNVSVTIGILVDADLKNKIRFCEDPVIQLREVNQTCERCPIHPCAERAFPPVVVEKRKQRQKVQEALKRLTDN